MSILEYRCKTEKVNAFGEELTVREMDGITFERFVRFHDQASDDHSRHAIIVAFSVVDSEGRLVFSEDDIVKLSKLPFHELKIIAEAASKLSRLYESGEEKN